MTACEQSPAPIRYETQHLQIGTQFDAPLCQGDLARWESLIVTLEEQLEVALSEPVTLYLWDVDDWDAQLWCDDDRLQGCFRTPRGAKTIYGLPETVDHELIHALVSLHGDPDSLFDEGVAEALAPDQRTMFGQVAPSDSLGANGYQVDYLTAGHFTRWLWEEWGREALVTLLRHSEQGPEAAFEGAFGMTLEAAQAQYLAQAPWSYAPLTTCVNPSLTQVEDRYWSESLSLDCESEHTRGGPGGLKMRRVVEIDARGHYALSTSAPGLAITRCMDEHVWEAPSDEDLEDGDIPPAYAAWPSNYTKGLDGDGVVNVLELAPGRYELGVNTPSFDAVAVELTMWEHFGPTPQIPEVQP